MPGIPTGNNQLALANLEGLGNNDRGDNVVLSATAKTLIRIADVFIQDYKRRMQRSGNVNTGKGGDLIKASDIEIDGSKMILDVLVPEYLLFQSLGVNGTKKNHGSIYSYGNKMPPVAPILQWVRQRSMRADKYKSIERARHKKGMEKDRTLKKAVDETKRLRGLAFAIAKGIQQKGIKPTKDIQNAGKSVERIFRKEIANGFKIDIINSLNDGNRT